MIERTDVVVVGGGVVGTAAAYHLSERGVETVLVDDDREGSATAAGAGIVSPPTSSRRENDDWFAFAELAAAHYPELISSLEAAGIDDHGYKQGDMLSVALTPAEAETIGTDRERARRRDASVEEISPVEAEAAFPALSGVERALRFPGAGRVDGAMLTAALRRAAHETGLTTVDGRVGEILTGDGAVSGVVVDGNDRIDADRVVVAGGAWSGGFGDDLGCSLPVNPIRGQIIHLDGSDLFDDAADLPIVGSVADNYIVPWPDGRIVVGATREDDAGFDPRITADGVREVLDSGLRLAPGLADATFEEVRVGLRPGSPDGLPILGGVPGVDGAYVATGHGPTGLTLGPYSGAVIAQLLDGEAPAADLSAFDPARF
ncbi:MULTISPECIES: NAD(P)/FAD-dependent oxidoreductase [Halolamina]|uniref:D-amino-acid dehydrogenase n=1 Tax=Halolamina pelagica TaxID=699431 RepID=A0A1I5SM20_9EURY|nr:MULTISPECIES: FAD-dependent oxidoreductase [Halolamina]NHX36991.1 FAD-dependent oxidoreductase [Halolamina sp. R1-12]SFP71782.1 D-amino-acid dehydrogenase [Halolamina pelagica]